MQPTMFNWCKGVLANLKGKITKEKKGWLKHFGYGAIVISFFLERIPILHPKISMDMAGPRDPRMLQWVSLMAHHRDGGPMIK